MMPGIIPEQRVESITADTETLYVADLYSPEPDQGHTVAQVGSYSVSGWGIEE
ncbi:hypothetical protein [Streptomyces bauhiniae]|uniref:Uncharacterized protein n=1 Tax=Streptomyces bauhiniae TaxID=2340725 RepID=A0A7K3QYE6_9ACTN|nr:hypothetical protein [Streptomyces bauhiniae]NEB94938.1 hypothetical protein [Streptomyces bauhiniae]